MDIRSYESSFELTFVLFNACLFSTMSCSSRIDLHCAKHNSGKMMMAMLSTVVRRYESHLAD